MNAGKITNLETFLAYLENVKPCNGQHTARCPGHDDKQNSLSVGFNSKDEKILLRCFAGCETSQIVSRLGLSVNDLFLGNGAQQETFTTADLAFHKSIPLDFLQKYCLDKSDGVQITYKNPDGTTKKCKQRKRSKLKGEKTFTWGGCGEVKPYGLWKLEKIKETKFCILVEGESDCWTLWHSGFPALGLPGATMIKKLEIKHVENLERIFIAQETDDAGIKFAESMLAHLEEIGFTGEKHILKMPHGCKDANDLWQKYPDDFKDLLETALHTASQQQSSSEQSRDKRPRIRLGEGQLHEVVNQADEILSKAAVQEKIFQKYGILVRIIQNCKTPKQTKRPPGLPVTKLLEIPTLTELFTKSARWEKWNKQGGFYYPVNCPKDISETYIARGFWNVPVLTGIISAPTLRPDGSILETSGYDDETGIYFWPGKTKFPKIPENPTREDAIKSLKLYLDLFSEFPFVDGAEKTTSLSVAISSCLTTLVRRSIRTAPLHGFSAPKMRSGKSLLSDIASIIANGCNTTKISFPRTSEEMEKRIFTFLLAGDPVICIDNVDKPIASDTLCSVITEDTWGNRILGASKEVKITSFPTWMATGNNLTFRGDLTSRSILCTLIPKVERPEERDFKINLRESPYVIKNRAKFVVAGLIILRAYIVAGKPKQDIKPYGGFEDWSNLVRSALVWLDMEDPCSSRKGIEDSDPDRESLTEVLSTFHEYLKILPQENRSITAKEIINEIDSSSIEQAVNLRKAFLSIAKDKDGNISSGRLGCYFRKYKFRIEGGLQLLPGDKTKNGIPWTVHNINSSETEVTKEIDITEDMIVQARQMLEKGISREDICANLNIGKDLYDKFFNKVYF